MATIVEGKATKETDYLCKAFPYYSRFPRSQSLCFPRYIRASIFLDRWDDRESLLQTRWHWSQDPWPIYCSGAAGESTRGNQCCSSIARSKSSVLETRNGCSRTRLLLADGWWYCRAPVFVLRRINPKEKFTLNTVGWSAKMRLSCSRRLVGLMVAKRKLYQSWSLFLLLKHIRICDQCCLYICCRSSELETRLAGMRTGSSSHLEPAAVVAVPGAWGTACGTELVLGVAVFFDIFAGGASVVLAAERLRLTVVVGCWCTVRIWAL